MTDYNRSDRYRDDNRSSSNERNYDMNWDRNYHTGDENRGYNDANRNVYSSDRERDFWYTRNQMNERNPDRNYTDYNNIDGDGYNSNDRDFNRSAYNDFRNRRYNDYNRNNTKDYNSRNYNYPNDTYSNDNMTDGWNNYKDRYNSYNHRYDDHNERYNRYNNWRDNDQRSDRGWWDKTIDEVASWFGDDDAERRRRRDEMRSGQHRGKGPKNYTRSEERIREDVSDILTDDSFLDASGIEVNVKGGDVTLNGHVDSRYSKHRAEDLAEDITGVKHVQNNLRVQENSDNVVNKSAVNNGDKNITSNTSFNTTKNKKETSNA